MDNNKPDCFAWISNKKCNALSCKNCEKCRFYRHESELPHYQEKFMSKEDREEREKHLKSLKYKK